MWTMLIIREAWYGSTRFSDFERVLGCPRNVLAERLRKPRRAPPCAPPTGDAAATSTSGFVANETTMSGPRTSTASRALAFA
ncbi:winged helix-turn-helix transcriptional regulator [Amycolatopsis sp. cmx-4-68]|uniref:winged helix-turn-helix transcriptional regulator n=1 Tax=Amycolatopsis sp. cmx-4-68 TaxID=2790938 RepID=UPI00397C49A8